MEGALIGLREVESDGRVVGFWLCFLSMCDVVAQTGPRPCQHYAKHFINIFILSHLSVILSVRTSVKIRTKQQVSLDLACYLQWYNAKNGTVSLIHCENFIHIQF